MGIGSLAAGLAQKLANLGSAVVGTPQRADHTVSSGRRRTTARPAGSYRGARRNAARAVVKQTGLKFSRVWPEFRTGGNR